MASPPSHSFHQPSRSRQTGRVLVLDSSPISLIALAGVLDAAGFECTCARTAEAAHKAITSEPQDLLVADVGDDAPAMLNLVTELRGITETQDLPAILIAGNEWAGLEKKTEPLGGVHCLFKPIDPTSLLAIVEQAMWMPHLVQTHRRRGSRPTHSGWITL